MKTIITGGTGLVGSTINIDNSVRLSSKDVDLKNWEKTLELFKSLNPKHVIHCVDRVGGIGGNMNYKGEFFYDNIMINTNVIEGSRRVGVEKVVSFYPLVFFLM